MSAQAQVVRNWEGSSLTRPKVIVKPGSVEELRNVVGKRDQFPSPVRAIGSNYSPNRCGVVDNGTLVDMTRLNKIVEVGPDFVRVQAGALFIDVAGELARRGLQFPVNVDLGNLSMGVAACGTTREASMPGEAGQLASYVSEMKVVTPNGRMLKLTEQTHPDLLKLMRSSYGLLGIVYEATFRVRPLANVAVHYEQFTLEEFCTQWSELSRHPAAMKLYLFPFRDRVAVEFRRYENGGGRLGRPLWKMRNFAFSGMLPVLASVITRAVPFKDFRYAMIEGLNGLVQGGVAKAVSHRPVSPTGQVSRFPRRSGLGRISYSTWAFPQEEYPRVLREYFELCRSYYETEGYRCNLLNLGVRLGSDPGSVLSPAFEGPVVTLEPFSTADEGWDDFLVVYNDFCSANGGVPVLNQTRAVTHAQAMRAFGARLRAFGELRRKVDPQNRFLNAYFNQLLC